MKKIVKVLLVLSLLIPSMLVYSYSSNNDLVAAKTLGDYTYEKINETAVSITNYNGSEKNVVVPSELDGKIVKEIGYSAFAECKSIETVIIPATITTIGSNAFSQCSQLREIKLAESVVSIGKYAFSGCISLEEVEIPSKVRGLGYGAFFDCISLANVTLPEGMQSIGEGSFGNCRSLTAIEFPSTLDSIEGNAFTGCIALQSINLSEGVTFIGSGVFSGCLSLADVQLPQSLRGIGQSAFQDCVSLTSVTLPDAISGIGYSAFSGCSNLTQINIPRGLSEIGNALFSGCSSLETIVIPSNITTIGEYSFSGCTNLKNVEIPNSVTKMGQEAFSYCSSLKTISLPKNMKEIAVSLFRYCTGLETLIIPNGVTEVGATALADCPGLLSVTIPNTVKKLGSRIFSNSPLVVLRVDDGSEGYRYAVNNKVKYSFLKPGINLDKKEVRLKVGETSEFTVILYPYTIIDNTQFTWTSSNPVVASIQNDGRVIALASGETTITVKNANGQSSSAEVIVDNLEVPITSLTIGSESLTMKKDSSINLRAAVVPSNTTMDKNITWESEDESVVSVSSIGLLRAKYPGKTKITATTSNGLKVSCEVVVISEIKSVSLNQTAMIMEEKSQQSLRASINPIDTTDSKEITWVSSNTAVATVDEKGIVTAVDTGTATISVITVNKKRAECKIAVVKSEINRPITSVTLNKESLTLDEADTETLTATINPSNTTQDKTLTWTTSDNEVASVDGGKVTGIKAGKAIITVTTSNGEKANCEVVVSKKEVPITSVTLNKESLTLDEADTETLIATINPSDTTQDKTLTWTTSDKGVASVDGGKVTGIKAGKAIITVTTSNGEKANCEVVVSKKEVPITSVTLNKESLTLDEADTETLTATINPSDTTQDKTLTWTTSDKDVASVEGGKVTGIKAGKATITVTASNGRKANCEVVVSKKEVPITSVTLNKESLKLMVGRTEVLIATINPYDTTQDKTIIWTTSDETIAKVDDTGNVTAMKEGVVIITATTSNNLSASSTVSVYEINKQLLETAISEAEKIDGTLYTTSSITKLNDALETAREINQNEEATQEQVDLIIVGLKNSTNELVLKASDEAIDSLVALGNKAIALSSQFTADDFETANALIKQIEILFENPSDEISNEEVTVIVEALGNEVKLLESILDVRKVLESVMLSAQKIVDGDTSDIDYNVILKMEQELIAAQAYLDTLSSDKDKMEDAIKKLNKSIADSETKLDKKILEDLIAQYYTCDSSIYSNSSWSVLEKEITNTEALLSGNAITQDAILRQYEKTIDAFVNLKLKVDTTSLEFNISMAQAILDSSPQYMTMTIRGLDTLVEQANTLLIDKNISEETIKDMNKKLIKAIMKARLKAI